MIQQPPGSTGSLIGARILARDWLATADEVSVAIAINPIDKSLIVVIELAFEPLTGLQP